MKDDLNLIKNKSKTNIDIGLNGLLSPGVGINEKITTKVTKDTKELGIVFKKIYLILFILSTKTQAGVSTSCAWIRSSRKTNINEYLPRAVSIDLEYW
jgi:hypothetical protein